MHRRSGFIISVCGMGLAILPLATVLRQPDFVTAAVGFGLMVLGVFVAIEAVARQSARR